MLISIIVAMDQARGIGLGGGLPWRLSADMKYFKQLTMGHTLIVGRRTWESIGRPLPGRRMIIISRQEDYICPAEVAVCNSLQEALDLAKSEGETEAFIGGGAAIYAEAITCADRIYLTRVQATVKADTFFPDFDSLNWEPRKLYEHPADEKNEHAFRLDLLERRKDLLPDNERA